MNSQQEKILASKEVHKILETKEVNTSSDRILPVQDIFTAFYKQDQSEYYERLHGVLTSFIDENTYLYHKLSIELPSRFNYFQLGSDLPSLSLLQFLIRLGGYKRILEIGTFIGVSAMHLAEAAGEGCEVVTAEIGQEFFEIASR